MNNFETISHRLTAGEEIKQLRKIKGLQQKIVATYVGLDHSSSVGRRTQKRNL